MDIPIPGTLDNPAPLFVVNFKLKNLDDPANRCRTVSMGM